MRELVWKFFRRVFFYFDPETAHRLIVLFLKAGSRCGAAPLRLISGASDVTSQSSRNLASQNFLLPKVWGMEFLSRVGLAAGFDKNVEILTALPSLGFGFAEIGTVTPKPQPGNDLPRLFRDSSQKALLNRMGFNNLGAELISARLRNAKEKLPSQFRVGVNLGKNKDTPLEKTADDYIRVTRSFEGLADYLVINVSSPNTPGLRTLQSVESLEPIVGGVLHIVQGWKKSVPVLVKLAPEVCAEDLLRLIQSIEPWGVSGWILTNTLAGTIQQGNQVYSGGWSGAPLREYARRSLMEVRKVSQKPIISVGGIDSLDEGGLRMEMGATLLQIYTSWIFQGPAFPVLLSKKLQSL